MVDVLSFGEVLVDRFPTYDKMGGAPANIAYNLTQLGTPCALISAVGKDETGKSLLKDLSHHGVVVDFVSEVRQDTGWVKVDFENDEARYTIMEDVAWDNIACSKELLEIAKTCKAFCFSSLALRSQTNRNTLEALHYNLSENALTIFDVNLRPPFYDKSILEHSFTHADVVKMNETEYQEISTLFETERLSEVLHSIFDVKMIILTLGKKGSRCITKDFDQSFPSELLDVSKGDSVGVGDAFISCITHHLLKNSPIETMMTAANRFAGYVATQQGAMVQCSPEILEEVR